METKEWYFFKWAYPCMYVLKQNGVITSEELIEFDSMYANGEAPSRETLERVNSAAFRRLENFARSSGRDKWDWEVLKGYWEKGGHNRVIEAREGNYQYFPEEFCNACMVNSGRVLSKETAPEGIVLKLDVEGVQRKFIQGKFLDANIGDIVLTHLAYAVQKA